jgi:hypothetical protein
MKEGGRSFREALPPERWADAVLLLRSLAARRGCGRMQVGRFLREYRANRSGRPGG